MAGKLIYSPIMSLDGYVADENGRFEWAEPDEEVHSFVNDLERPVGSYLYGRRMYEVMLAWDTIDPQANRGPVASDFARIWQAADKIVYSRTLNTVPTARTQIRRNFEADEVRQLKVRAERDITIGGADLAASAFKAGLIDELQLFVVPMLVGGGTRSMPAGVRMRLELLDERRFGSGMVFLRYRATSERQA